MPAAGEKRRSRPGPHDPAKYGGIRYLEAAHVKDFLALLRVERLLGVVGLDKARIELDSTELPEEVGRYMVALARTTRSIDGVELGVSSRGIMHWASASKAAARLNGRSYVTVQDVQEIAPYVLRHRLIMRGDAKADDALDAVFEQVPAPEPFATFVYV